MFNAHLANSIPKPVNNALRAATLVRVSTAEQATEGRSGVERQRRSNDAVVASKGYQVVASYELIDVSGTVSFQSAEMLELTSLVEKGMIDVLVCSEMSRILRPDDWSSFASLDIFKRHDVLLDCGGTIHDLKSPEGFLAGGLLALLGGHERMAMQRKMRQSKEASRAAGRCPSSAITLPLGLHYDRAVGKFQYTSEIWKIQEAFRLIDEDGIRNLSEVARRVGIHQRALPNSLQNKSYIGIREYTKMRDPNRKGTKADGRQGDRPKIQRPPDKVISVRIIPPEEQAVDDERFARVQHFLTEMADRHARVVVPGKGMNLLSAIGFCGCCGQRLYTTTSSRRESDGEKVRGHYICKSQHYMFKSTGTLRPCSQTWTRKDRIDELVTAFVARFLDDGEFVSSILAHAMQKQRGTVIPMTESDPLKHQLAELERRDRRLLDAIEAGAISLAEAKERRTRLDDERRTLLAIIERQQPKKEASLVPTGIIGRIASMGGSGFAALTCPRERKVVISALFMEIYIKGESITAFRLAPSLVANDRGDWGWVADVAVTLPEPFRIHPEKAHIDVPADHRQCTRCKAVLSFGDFYGTRPACRQCEGAANRARYKARVEAKKAREAEQG